MNHWWNVADRKNQSAQTTPVQVPVHSVKKKISHGLAWKWTQASVTSVRWLPDVWHSHQPLLNMMHLNGCIQCWTNIVFPMAFPWQGWTDPWWTNFVEWCLIFSSKLMSFSPLHTKMCISFTCTKQMCHLSIQNFRSSVSNLLHFALLVLGIWSWALDFWKVYGPQD